MRATSIGHAGMLIETDAGSIVCDPWFVPAFFGSWFVFPRNDQLSDDLRERIEQADFLYISHLHGDHHDEPWLREHLRRDIPILLPGFPTREQQRTLRTHREREDVKEFTRRPRRQLVGDDQRGAESFLREGFGRERKKTGRGQETG